MIQRVEAGRDLGPQALANLGQALPGLMQKGVRVLSLDASHVVEFDSRSLEALLEFDALVRSRGLGFEVVEPSELLHAALTVTGLAARMEIRMAEPAPADTGAATGAPPAHAAGGAGAAGPQEEVRT